MLFISSEIVFFCLRFCLVSLWHAFLLASWKRLYVSFAGKELKDNLIFVLYLTVDTPSFRSHLHSAIQSLPPLGAQLADIC